MPYTIEPSTDYLEITIDVDDEVAMAATGNQTDVLFVYGNGAPDGVILTDSQCTYLPGGFFSSQYVEWEHTGAPATDMVLHMKVPPGMANWVGFTVVFGAWMSNVEVAQTVRLGVSTDDRATWMETAAQTLNVTVLQPEYHEAVFQVPYSVTDNGVWLRIRVVAPAVGSKVGLHKMVAIGPDGSLFLGSGTAPRNQHRAKRGEALLIWSPTALDTGEVDVLGLGASQAHIQRVGPAHSLPEPRDISEYAGGSPVNIFGAWEELAFTSGTMSNMDIVLRTPERFTYLVPTLVSNTAQVLEFDTGANTATLTVSSNESQTDCVVTEDEIPITNDTWVFNSATQVEILARDPAKTYEITYQALIRFVSDTIDLGANYSDFVWFADNRIVQRVEAVPGAVLVTEQLSFLTDFTAALGETTTQDRTQAILIADDGIRAVVVEYEDWEFVDDSTIQVSPSVFNRNVIYTLTYEVLTYSPTGPVVVVMEMKSATTAVGLGAATWNEISPNDPIETSKRYHSIRVTLTNVVDVGAVQMQMVGVKGMRTNNVTGISLFGEMPSVTVS
jgi:hypothetical protein